MKKIVCVIFTLIILASPISVFAEEDQDWDVNEETEVEIVNYEEQIQPRGPACQYSVSYSESVSSEASVQQFTHDVEAQPIQTSVTRTVSLTSSLQIKAGASTDVNFVLANTRASFELSYTGSKMTSVSITWGPIPKNKAYTLVAGKKYVTVTGKINVTNTDCTTSSRTISLYGSLRTYHNSYAK